MDFLKQAFFMLLCVFVAGFCFVLLWASIRFGVISNQRTRGWQNRLRQPQLEEVAAHWNVTLPAALETFYRETSWIERGEFRLARSASPSESRWHVHSFIPLTVRDLKQWIAITDAPGLPLATGGDDGKSVFYLPFDALRRDARAPVLMRPAGLPVVEVACDIEAFARFNASFYSDDDDEWDSDA